MGWKLWLIVTVVLVIAVVWMWRWLFGSKNRKLPFIGLSPLTGGLKAMKAYVSGLGGHLLDSDDESVPTGEAKELKEEVPVDPVSTTALHIPLSWDFRDITGSHKRERIVRRVLETLFQREFPSVRPKWLVNDATSRRLEIDCFNEELGLAVEHQGAQHYHDGTGFHKTRHDFLKQIYRDRIKKEMILERGLNYIIVPYTVRQDRIPQYIIDMLRKLGYT